MRKASLAIGTENYNVERRNGNFYTSRPGKRDGRASAGVGRSKVAGEEEILASAAVANGRVYLVSTKNTYCIGSRRAPRPRPAPSSHLALAAAAAPDSNAPPALVQASPAEAFIGPGQDVRFRA